MTAGPDGLPRLQGDADYATAVPTPDHFIPLLYLAGLGAAAGAGADVLVDGYAYGSLSMTSYTLGGTAATGPSSDAGVAPPPHVAGDESNM
jgi:4,5-DOPA dioxygenase extradiol